MSCITSIMGPRLRLAYASLMLQYCVLYFSQSEVFAALKSLLTHASSTRLKITTAELYVLPSDGPVHVPVRCFTVAVDQIRTSSVTQTASNDDKAAEGNPA